MKKFTLLFLAAFSAIFFSCSNDDGDYSTDIIVKNKVIILNQGNYTEQNSSIYVYDEDTRTMTPNAYATANNGTKLGATLMSATFSTNGVGYLLCSNPDKIQIVDILTMKNLTAPVSDKLSNVREIMGVGQYLFVTNAGTEYNVLPDGSYEYTNSYVSAYSTSGLVHMENVEVGSDAQGMAYLDNRLFVGTKDGIVVIIREGSRMKIENVYQDEEFKGAVKYLCVIKDKVYASVPGYGIFEYNPFDGRTTKRFEIPMDSNGYITMNKDGKIYTYATIYNTEDWSVESSNVYELDPSTGDVQTIASGEYLYSVGVSHYTNNVFTSEANGFTTNSTMQIYNPEKGLVGAETAGVGTFRYLFVSYVAPANE